MVDELLPELTPRQEEILSQIITHFAETPEPVSSKQLADSEKLNVSSATVRNEMARLEELGYITAPHTSAGRIPTAHGYRYFVKQLLRTSQLAKIEQDYITEKFDKLPVAIEQWLRQAATILARTANTASLVTHPMTEHNRFKHVELISIQGRLALMVLVLNNGSVYQRMLNLAEPVPQTELSDVANRINTICAGLTANQVKVKNINLSLFEREITDLIAELIERANTSPARAIYQDGLSEIIDTFPDNEGTQQAIRVFEKRAFLDMLLTEILSPIMTQDDIHVVIAGDERWDEINQLGMVFSRYGVPGQISGTLGVLGPTHINYGRAISTVRYVSSIMTERFAELYGSSNISYDNDSAEANDE